VAAIPGEPAVRVPGVLGTDAAGRLGTRGYVRPRGLQQQGQVAVVGLGEGYTRSCRVPRTFRVVERVCKAIRARLEL
jgi:hypothetical protein